MQSQLIKITDDWTVVGDIETRGWLGLAYKDDHIDFVTQTFGDDVPDAAFAEHLALFLDAEVIETEHIHGVIVEFPTDDDPETFKLAYVTSDDTVYIAASEDRQELTEKAKSYNAAEATG